MQQYCDLLVAASKSFSDQIFQTKGVKQVKGRVIPSREDVDAAKTKDSIQLSVAYLIFTSFRT